MLQSVEEIKKILQTILQKKNEGKKLYLVLGGYVNANENKRGRTFFNDDNVYIVDQVNCTDSCPFKERYLQMDDMFFPMRFTRLFKFLDGGECFDTILFDWSTYKFLFQKPDNLGFRDRDTEHIFKTYNKLLKPGGYLIIDDPKMAYGIPPDSYIKKKRNENPNEMISMNSIAKNYIKEIGDRNLSWLTERLQNAGFTNFTFVQDVNQITDPIVKKIYTEGVSELLPVLISEKPVPSKGGKRKSRKSRKTRKNKFSKSK